MENEEKNLQTATIACTSCGADLKYQPGTQFLTCEYCGAKNEIEILQEDIEELDFEAYLNQASDSEEKLTATFVKCESCGASSSLDPNIASAMCPYCSSPLLVEQAHDVVCLCIRYNRSSNYRQPKLKTNSGNGLTNCGLPPTT